MTSLHSSPSKISLPQITDSEASSKSAETLERAPTTCSWIHDVSCKVWLFEQSAKNVIRTECNRAPRTCFPTFETLSMSSNAMEYPFVSSGWSLWCSILSWWRNPTLGRMTGRRARTLVYASLNVRFGEDDNIKYAMTSDDDLEIPAWQCTKTRPWLVLASVINLATGSKRLEMSWSGASRNL